MPTPCPPYTTANRDLLISESDSSDSGAHTLTRQAKSGGRVAFGEAKTGGDGKFSSSEAESRGGLTKTSNGEACSTSDESPCTAVGGLAESVANVSRAGGTEGFTEVVQGGCSSGDEAVIDQDMVVPVLGDWLQFGRNTEFSEFHQEPLLQVVDCETDIKKKPIIVLHDTMYKGELAGLECTKYLFLQWSEPARKGTKKHGSPQEGSSLEILLRFRKLSETSIW